jgi:hypothetical protein
MCVCVAKRVAIHIVLMLVVATNLKITDLQFPLL